MFDVTAFLTGAIEVVWQEISIPHGTLDGATVFWEMLERPRRREDTCRESDFGELGYCNSSICSTTVLFGIRYSWISGLVRILGPDINAEVQILQPQLTSLRQKLSF